jgi:hypothetical protein
MHHLGQELQSETPSIGHLWTQGKMTNCLLVEILFATVKRIATAVPLVIAIAFSTAPLTASACAVSNIEKHPCRDCCATIKCCAQAGKKVTQPLANSTTSHELTFNLSPKSSVTIRSFVAGTFIRQPAANWLTHSPPKRALFCTFLI